MTKRAYCARCCVLRLVWMRHDMFVAYLSQLPAYASVATIDEQQQPRSYTEIWISRHAALALQCKGHVGMKLANKGDLNYVNN
mmetsp:Transcript_158323/g.288745  ORF Transcript_158323/g.288745 Transcript_158323/m.288745 type:complete len:83 (+) Transcript_158323:189-437(+)